MADEFGICGYVREIRALSASLTENTPRTVFLSFPNLHTAFIDAHNDFTPTEQASSHNRPTPLGRYHLIASHLPSSLRRLWIVNAHGPDAAVIQTLSIHCPHLEELLISRCTIFSPRMREQAEGGRFGACKHWELFPEEHDSYFSTEGVPEYAESLGRELMPLTNLKKLHMGLYFTSYEAIEQHQRAHIELTTGTSLWDAPCGKCSEVYADRTKTAETTASQAIFASNPGLAEVSWASFFTEARIGATSYTRDNTPRGQA